MVWDICTYLRVKESGQVSVDIHISTWDLKKKKKVVGDIIVLSVFKYLLDVMLSELSLI